MSWLSDLGVAPDEGPKFLYDLGQSVIVTAGGQTWTGTVVGQIHDEECEVDIWYQVQPDDGLSRYGRQPPILCSESELSKVFKEKHV
jgi:hypothetical protein